MKKLRNIIMGLVFIIAVLISTQVSANFEVFKGDLMFTGGRFQPQGINREGIFYCIQGHGSLKPTLERGKLEGHYVGEVTRQGHTRCGPDVDNPWGGNVYKTVVYSQTNQYNTRACQDIIYAIAKGGQGMNAQYALWTTLLNKVNGGAMEADNALSQEARAYKEFYKLIHDNFVDVDKIKYEKNVTDNLYVDRYQDLVKDNTIGKDVKISVNRTDKSYTIGPLNLSYPNGNYNGINQWSWITTAKLYDQNDKEITDMQILDSNGQLVYDTDNEGNLRNVPKNGENFYIKFKTDGSVRDVYFDVNFKYLESHSAQIWEYQGKYYYYSWEYKKNESHWVTNSQGDNKRCKRYYYKLEKHEGSSAQTLLAYKGTVNKNYKEAKLRMPFTIDNANPRKPSKPHRPGEPEKPSIDITMDLSGKVFLDQDQGKVNEGNNILDEGEALGGVEVTLYDVETNQIVVNRDTGKNYVTLTNNEGYYEFTRLDAQKTYYVRFTYNGMLYTNVLYNRDGDDTSKATEEGQNHTTNRADFNNLFSEIGSYPQNYKVVNDIFGLKYNRVYLQEEVADVFKQVSAKIIELNGDEMAAYHAVAGGDKEMQQKVQFVADCRIHAYTMETYAIPDEFVIDNINQMIAGKEYPPIYSNVYNQTNVNLGIKARSTFDMALYKDIFNAVLNINGKQETYTYDARKDWNNDGFSFGVREDDYLNQLREKYINGTETSLQTTETIDEGSYTHEYRTEEIVNGNNQNTAINPSALYDENKNYAWRDINSGLAEADKLQIHVTYKLAIRNQSNIVGSVTELVDYYDNHYQFEKAYMADKDGNIIPDTKVEASEESMYGSATHRSTDGKYKTIYLRPTETKLGDGEEQYVYVTFGLINPEQTLIAAGLPNGNKFYTYNLAEINGYKTYEQGLIDRDSNSGNFDPSSYEMGKTPLEDDESKAPAFVYSIRNSRTLEGTVFEDELTSKNSKQINTNQARFGNGTIDNSDKKIEGIKVELVEVKNGQLVSRQTTYTDRNGWYGFGAFLPGDYTIRFTYGADNNTALTKTSQYVQGLNDTSYNGQDYQSTIFTTKQGETVTPHNYKVDTTLSDIYNKNNEAKNSEESDVKVSDQVITKYETQGYYWFDDVAMVNKSDATDDMARRNQVIAYSKSEYGREITNYKAEVFNSYKNQKTLRDAETKDNGFDENTQAQPMEEVVDTKEKNAKQVDELERRTYMYAYTPEIPVEVEYTTQLIAGNLASDKYTYKIVGVDFGVVERPRSELTIDQDIAHVKVLATDGSTILELNNNNGKIEVAVDNGNNYQWINIGQLNQKDQNELLNIILDDELLSGAKLEVTYNITVTNNSEQDANTTTRAKNIVNYIANNLNFDLNDNKGLWEAVKKEDMQTTLHSSFINNELGRHETKQVDLSTQATVIKTTEANPLTKALKPGESVTSTLTLKKTLSAESAMEDLSYSNLSEIVEIDSTVGRYDHGAIPGNQNLEEQPREHDTSGSSRYDEIDQEAGTRSVKTRYPQDGTIIITPPTGDQKIYYVLGITMGTILLIGILVIKYVVDKKKTK